LRDPLDRSASEYALSINPANPRFLFLEFIEIWFLMESGG